ncbi:MarR family transcriptional regulator [Subsaximicrobium wynnwilliamsii]|uniref:MarR family transcriptional regulator n=1 Tax=Subsaximicrobium wynnwilliamsii TaxID=291179 RepID=A0A5C6ZFC1_9FLAO|nr:MarR family transcriptional regulator [Subsaximicrobium wynnwilliamsii]TXD82970.1 MarR family transcriptional regulator [Subsaximicrobium wynnwilliamsii]TXD88692.1 MarR family transcriptional regulator [Subsaximicrobium wynnwilliamsii]TXE02785.1 MarR family transcriptional regulator [Subsaximicrobium wynnwilliamsii]
MGDLAKDIHSRFTSHRVKALLNILYTANWISSAQTSYLKSYGISPQQYNILRILRGSAEPLKVQTIKDRMIERSPNTTRLMDKLCAKQLISRIASEADRRVVKIKLTNKGDELLTSIPSDLNQELLKNLSEIEAEQLSTLLDKMR